MRNERVKGVNRHDLAVKAAGFKDATGRLNGSSDLARRRLTGVDGLITDGDGVHHTPVTAGGFDASDDGGGLGGGLVDVVDAEHDFHVLSFGNVDHVDDLVAVDTVGADDTVAGELLEVL